MTAAYVGSGRLLAAVAAREGWPAVHENPSLLTDALLAASCEEAGISLVTRDRDFDRFAPEMRGWSHVPPWPDVM